MIHKIAIVLRVNIKVNFEHERYTSFVHFQYERIVKKTMKLWNTWCSREQIIELAHYFLKSIFRTGSERVPVFFCLHNSHSLFLTFGLWLSSSQSDTVLTQNHGYRLVCWGHVAKSCSLLHLPSLLSFHLMLVPDPLKGRKWAQIIRTWK